jgi:hypothetical protein
MKSQTKKIIVSSIVAFGALFCEMDANSTCTKTGVVISSFTSSTGTFYNLVPVAQFLPTFADQFFVTGPSGTPVGRQLEAASATGQVVTVTGTGPAAGGCVTTGQFRNEGNVTAVSRFAQ